MASEMRLTAALIAVTLVSVLVPTALKDFPRNRLSATVPIVVLALALDQLMRHRRRPHQLLIGTMVMVSALVVGAVLIWEVRSIGLDVVQLHLRAAAVIAGGHDPYSSAVSVPNGNPDPSARELIVGYPYPPVIAAAFSLATWLWGDPRWASLLSWAVVAVCSLALLASKPIPQRSLLPFFLLMAFPGWGTILQSGWTEPLSTALVALAAISWERPIVSGLALGAAIGSKQYFVVALPLIALYRGNQWQRRAITALLVCSLTLLPAFAWNPASAWRSLVLFPFHLQGHPQADSANIVGMLWRFDVHWTPGWIGAGVSLAVVSLLAPLGSGPGHFCRTLAAGLGALFMFAPEAQPNYWYIVAAIAALGSQVGSPRAYLSEVE